MQRTKREREIEAYLRRAVREAGGICWKFVSPGRRGVPDDFVALNGRCCFVEVKSATGTIEPAQQLRHDELRDAGIKVSVVRSEEDVDAMLYALAN